MTLPAIDRNPPARTLRLFAGLWFPLFFGLIGLRVWTRTGSLAVAGAIWLATAAVAVICLAWLPMARLLFVGLSALTVPLGYVFAHVVLGVAFFCVVTPIGLVLRAFGFDPMSRKIDRAARSYWIPRAERVPLERYFRQY